MDESFTGKKRGASAKGRGGGDYDRNKKWECPPPGGKSTPAYNQRANLGSRFSSGGDFVTSWKKGGDRKRTMVAVRGEAGTYVLVLGTEGGGSA